jgi:Holliday junction resolvasome RuvABC endonuclease subunit
MILGLDGGLGMLGYAVVRPRTGHVVELGTLTSKPAEGVDEHTDRMRRGARIGASLRGIAVRHNVTQFALETPSLGGPPKARLSMGIALYLFAGVVLGLAVSLNVDVVAVTPKQWQHAITGEDGKVDYDVLFARLHTYVAAQSETLLAIPPSQRNHALDAVGVGLFASLVEHTQSMRVMEAWS